MHSAKMNAKSILAIYDLEELTIKLSVSFENFNLKPT